MTFSRYFPAYHPRKGEPTYFVEQIWNSLNELKLPVPKNKDLPHDFMWSILPLSNYGAKHHTIRAGNRWKVGDKFSPRVWSGKPYNSKQIIIAPDIEIKKVWNFEIKDSEVNINGFLYNGKTKDLIKNDGLEEMDFWNWFQFPNPFSGQIICWNENINY